MADDNHNNTITTAVLLRIGGQVQGVGFRPFVYRIANRFDLTGWVENHGAEVQLLFEGDGDSIEQAIEAVLKHAPPLARPALIARHELSAQAGRGFTIRTSRENGDSHPHIPPDYFLCNECLQELNTPDNRRYRYPFINCTQCGPRYTLINSLPYDRSRTTMAAFPLCSNCREEYEAPLNRRFHAEPLACPECGPQLSFSRHDRVTPGNEAALSATLSLLREGGIVAVKGVGGYHLMCDAANRDAVKRLRRRKARPHKPLAVMFPQSGPDGLERVRAELLPTASAAKRLTAPLRPIVLCPRREDSSLAPNLAPGLDEIGAMLPYSPLHHLLLQDFGRPLVATSGNLSGEPVLTENTQAEQRLRTIADAFLHHNRPIRRPADDPVYRESAGILRPLRLGRGNAPLERQLPFTLDRTLLAVGGEMKNSIALAWDDRVVLSPHIGELHSPRALEVFEQLIQDLQTLYGVKADTVVHDAHPDYQASRWARESAMETVAVYHHHAHASALYGEYQHLGDGKPLLVATWDGVGYGPDGTAWGGECLLGRPGQWRRFGQIRPFRLPGGDKAGREPWRSALGLCLETGHSWKEAPEAAGMLEQAWRRGLNSPQTTAVGRLFDAAAALLGLCRDASFEGQAGMLLEAAAGDYRESVSIPLQRLSSGVWQSDWGGMLPLLLDTQRSVSERAAIFHHSLVESLLQQALQAREEYGIDTVGLCGGVFQNRYLVEAAAERLAGAGFTVRLAEAIPCNDGGLAWGQIIEACAVHRP